MITRLKDIDRMFGAMDTIFNTNKIFNMDRIFNDFDRTFLSGPVYRIASRTPRVDLLDNNDNYLLQAEVPGSTKEDIKINIEENILEISGQRKLETPDEYQVLRNERTNASFQRKYTLPEDVDTSRVEAELKDGILTLTLPKSEAAKPKQITIN